MEHPHRLLGSPSKNALNFAPSGPSSAAVQLNSPRAGRTLRKLQSAQALSSNYTALNAPSVVPNQRQSQQKPPHPLSQNRVLPPTEPPLRLAPRPRANSDVSIDSLFATDIPIRQNVMARRPIQPQLTARDQLEALVEQGPGRDVTGSLARLRHLILTDGLYADGDGLSPSRIYVWQILLNAPPVATERYLDLIHRGASPAYAKIRNDTFRTLATDPLFKRRVSESQLIRLLNAIAWVLHDSRIERMTDSGRINAANEAGSPELQHVSPIGKHTRLSSTTTATEGSDAGGTEPGVYVQGMNVLCAPFLYVARSEVEAFAAYQKFITNECPGYVRGTLDGVHRGVALVDKCLAIVDPSLYTYLHSKGMSADIYAFASVLTMCACTPPLPEVLLLWDFLFAFGPHLNILCICAQLVILRDSILSNPSPTKILRNFPPLHAAKIRETALSFMKKIPIELYDELLRHAQ